ncbi:hypothetical protein B0A52_05579 [Exophiala mesophila]|uniref:Ima1 N-terminal domain-containing protein n=1 Tax=Exophiala mesophila TaxID=212818 RepID=A0A438N3N3_EXOME|nr:hypothetical protein B0A52_05579 [Exophiala mesophila]
MPIQLRPRLNCHYCGHRSKSGKAPGQKFKCDNCLAVNFFDENGEIADVPIDVAAPLQRFAQPAFRDPLADDYGAQDSIFCSTCLKNQHLYTYNLSQFLPDPDHPEYARYEADFPAFKKELEKRYPQCCAQCEPKVRRQLQQATYNARTDHVRRVLDKSRQRRIASRLGWRSLLVSAAGCGYGISLATQVVWHLYGSQVQWIPGEHGLNIASCLKSRTWSLACFEQTESIANLSLILGLLCIWWNPKWQHKISNNEGRLIGLQRYYLIQLAILFLRFAALALLHHIPFTETAASVLHAVFAISIAVAGLWSTFRIITIRLAQPIDWHQDPAALLTSGQFNPPPTKIQQQLETGGERAFNIDSLSSVSAQTYEAWKPPSPPDTGDSMDWTPTQPTFSPAPKPVRVAPSGPSPFFGKLPALNAKGIRTNSGQQMKPKEAIGLPPGFFDKKPSSALSPQGPQPPSDAFAQPKFFGLQGQADTGLEKIFDSVFSLKDSSVEEQMMSAQKSSQATPLQESTVTERAVGSQGISSGASMFSGISFFVILVAVTVWLFETSLKPTGSDMGFYITILSAAIPIGHLLHDLVTGRFPGQVARPLIFVTEAVALICLAVARDHFGGAFRDLWNKLAIGLVALLLPHEFVQMHSAELTSRPPTTITPPTKVPEPAPIQEPELHHDMVPPYPDHQFQPSLQYIPPQTPTYSSPTRPHVRASRPRRDSDESTTSKTSISTASSVAPWETPQPSRYGDSQQINVPRNSNSVSTELRGLSLGDDGSSRRNNRGSWRASDSMSSGANVAGPRSRRR